MEPVKQRCFSLLEIAIALMLAGLILTALAAGSGAARKAEMRMAYQAVVVPCVTAAGEAMRQDATEAHAVYPATRLDDTLLVCTFAASTGHTIDRVILTGAPPELQTLMQESLPDGSTIRVEGATVTLTPPTGVSAGQ